jgi:hypothetical protein
MLLKTAPRVQKQHATTMSDALVKQGCLAIGLSPSEIAHIMKAEADESEGLAQENISRSTGAET